MVSPVNRSTSLSSKASPVTTATSELPYRSSSQRIAHSRDPSGNYPTPPQINSPTHRQEAFSDYTNSVSSKQSPSNLPNPNEPVTRRRRGSSLTERFPGDTSHKPLATLSREKAIADKSRHMVRKHYIPPDTIDALDNIGPDGKAYHHGGPYDATLRVRNTSLHSSPVEAVRQSNAEALKATPQDKIMDSVRGHRPLDGVATYPPGFTDRSGQTYEYTEGENMMIGSGPGDTPEGGAYKRWPGVEYKPDDVKGKGEPSYTIEKSLKDSNRRSKGEENDGIEMTDGLGPGGSRPGSSGVLAEVDATGASVGRSGSVSKRLSGGMKRRIGSIKRHLGASDS